MIHMYNVRGLILTVILHITEKQIPSIQKLVHLITAN
jgi:hypothetical protein